MWLFRQRRTENIAGHVMTVKAATAIAQGLRQRMQAMSAQKEENKQFKLLSTISLQSMHFLDQDRKSPMKIFCSGLSSLTQLDFTHAAIGVDDGVTSLTLFELAVSKFSI